MPRQRPALQAHGPRIHPVQFRLQALLSPLVRRSKLVAFFFRRSFELLRARACLGLIATNTAFQGDTRYTGLRWLRRNGATFYRAVKRYVWPNDAAVIACIVHARKGTHEGPRYISGREVPLITAYLIHFGPDENAQTLTANAGIAFKGAEPGSLGYLVEPSSPEYTAFRALRNPADPSKPLLKLYVGGKSQNRSTRERYVIDVNGLSESQLKQLPAVQAYLEGALRTDLLRRGEINEDTVEWWHFRRPTNGMREALQPLARCMACSRYSPHLAVEFRSTDEMLSETMIVFASHSHALFAVLQSSVHEIWARIMASTLEDRLRYTPTDCFETFPLPHRYENNPALEAAGRRYYEFRAALMIRNRQGLTKIYTRFHDPVEQSEEFQRLRALQQAMDHAVLDAYDWTEIHPIAQFEVEFEEEETDDDEFSGTKRPKEKHRLRWPEDVRDEVLARLLALNEQRAAEEALEHKSKPKKKPAAATPLFDKEMPGQGDKE
ncbi:MAG TPA: type IIL restriction-modification enzyme MmeI [Bryobacteraceae bacterium]